MVEKREKWREGFALFLAEGSARITIIEDLKGQRRDRQREDGNLSTCCMVRTGPYRLPSLRERVQSWSHYLVCTPTPVRCISIHLNRFIMRIAQTPTTHTRVPNCPQTSRSAIGTACQQAARGRMPPPLKQARSRGSYSRLASLKNTFFFFKLIFVFLNLFSCFSFTFNYSGTEIVNLCPRCYTKRDVYINYLPSSRCAM